MGDTQHLSLSSIYARQAIAPRGVFGKINKQQMIKSDDLVDTLSLLIVCLTALYLALSNTLEQLLFKVN